MHAFREAFRILDNRIKIFTSLPLEKVDRLAIVKVLRDIGTVEATQTP
jgi:arsenate reductase